MTYRVVFVHSRYGTKFETRVKNAKDMGDALPLAEEILARHIGATAGQPTGWSHQQTIEEAE